MLVYESANETRSSKSAIFSPTYAGDYINNSCLSIMFKQNGYNMGTFNVFIVPENDEYLNQPLLTFKGNKGPQWNLWTVTLKDQTHVQGPFQIVYQKMSWRSDFYAYFFMQVLEAIRGNSYLSNIYIKYIEILTDDADRCNWLIQTSKVIEHANDILSPESCQKRCYKNTSKPYWTKGHCGCSGQGNLCEDFYDICNPYEASQFLQRLGLSSWTSQVLFFTITVTAIVAVGFIFGFLWYKRSWSSVIPRMISEQDIYGRITGTRAARYVANNLDDDTEDFINFELAAEEGIIPDVDFIMDHQYATIQEFHRYEEPPSN